MQPRSSAARRFVLGLASMLFLIPASGLLAQPAPAATSRPTTQAAEDPAVPAIKTGRGADAFVQKHQKYLERAKQGDIDIVFMGDSITEGWGTRGKSVWQQRYADRKAVNFGVGGDRTQHVLWRIANGELDGINPKAVVLMIGTNNTGANTAPDIVRGVTACVRAIQKKLPDTRIVLVAIFPRGHEPTDPKRQEINEINPEIKKLADGDKVRWLDFNDKLLEPDGTISKEMMPDHLHPVEKGYQIWADALDPVLAEIIQK